MVRPQCINRPYCSRGKSGISLDDLSPSPPDRKRVTPVGNVGSPPSSLLMLNLTSFLGFSSVWMGALPCHALLPDSWVLACSFKSHIWRHNCLLGGPDLGGLGDDDEDCLWHSGEGLWYHLDLLLLLNWEHHFCDLDHPVGESSLGHLVASLAYGSAEGAHACKAELPWRHLCEGLMKLGVPVGQP